MGNTIEMKDREEHELGQTFCESPGLQHPITTMVGC